MNLEYAKDNIDRLPLDYYLDLYGKADPLVISKKTQIPYNEEKKTFTLQYLGITYHISWPAFEVWGEREEVIGQYPLEGEANSRILILRYLLEGTAVPASGNYRAFRDLPSGELYFRQFQGRCLFRLGFGYGNRLEEFSRVMEKLGAEPSSEGDASYIVTILGNFKVKCILWKGDEEFPPSAQILFSDNFNAAFEDYDLVVVCDILISLMKAMGRK